MALPSQPSSSEFSGYDLSFAAAGDWVEHRADSDVESKPGIARTRHDSLMACVAADAMRVFIRVDDLTKSPLTQRLLFEVERRGGTTLRAWRCPTNGGLEVVALRPGISASVRERAVVPTLQVLLQRRKTFRGIDPPVEGCSYLVRSTLRTPYEHMPTVTITAASAFAAGVPFPLLMSDAGTRARMFLPVSWSEQSLEPATLVFLRTRRAAARMTFRLVRWGRGDRSLMDWGTSTRPE